MKKVLSAKQAVQVAEQYAKDTIETLNIGRSHPEFSAMLRDLQDASEDDTDPGHRRGKVLMAQMEAFRGAQFVNLSILSIQTAAAVRLWRQHRVVYRVHPGLAECLIDTDTRAEVPCEVFARLPHPDPFVVFPTPLPAPVARDGLPAVEPPMFVGMQIAALTANETVCSTADPRAAQLYVLLASKIHYVGGHPSHDEATVFVPMSGTYSIDALLDRHAEYDQFGQISRDEQRQVHNLALSLLLYLCSDRRDARNHESDAGRRGRKGRRQEPRTIIDLGFDVGPALHTARHGAEHDEHGGTTGARVRSHLRRAHWHTYWTGPRSAQTPEVRWLHPILVNRRDHRPERASVIDVDLVSPTD
ncbi:hypothetical protein [Nocardia sp. XZ_19_369]|uniref:hypothetical protein n=1 Tax=Nocardia sp. XZ_19_369 TaxID=2769487 RepID=UPI00188E0F42|nr:hypothetical protein [Nocardia sp. XZ_19_369]